MKHFDYYLKDVPTPQLKPEAYKVILEIMEEIDELIYETNKRNAYEEIYVFVDADVQHERVRTGK